MSKPKTIYFWQIDGLSFYLINDLSLLLVGEKVTITVLEFCRKNVLYLGAIRGIKMVKEIFVHSFCFKL